MDTVSDIVPEPVDPMNKTANELDAIYTWEAVDVVLAQA